MRGLSTNEARVKELTDTLYVKLDAYEEILSKRKYLAGDVSGTLENTCFHKLI